MMFACCLRLRVIVMVEGLGALEVLRHGVVPVLARGSLTVTSQCALSAESVFEAGNPRSLARAIHAWIERGDEARRSEATHYREVGQRYDIRSCVGELERVYGWLVTGVSFLVASLTGERTCSCSSSHCPRH